MFVNLFVIVFLILFLVKNLKTFNFMKKQVFKNWMILTLSFKIWRIEVLKFYSFEWTQFVQIIVSLSSTYYPTGHMISTRSRESTFLSMSIRQKPTRQFILTNERFAWKSSRQKVVLENHF